MVCNDRQLTQAQLEEGFAPRTGVTKAIRPFSGPATPENLVDYLNREVFPVLKAAREKLNEVYQQVADQAPSANPLSYYFSESIVAADPTAGFLRLNSATQNTSTIIRVSEQNARLVSTVVWFDVMAGGATVPIGVVTLADAINPGRFIRFNLDSMVDNGTYWDFNVTPVESSHANPFVENEAITIGFIASVASGGVVAAPGVAAPADAQYVLGAADVDLPNGLVATDSSSIDVTTGAGTISWAPVGGFFTWAYVLGQGATSGANNPIVSVGQFMQFGLAGPTTSSPQIRSGDAVFRIRGSGAVVVGGDVGAVFFAASSNLEIAADAGNVAITTNLGTPRLVIANTGEWTTPSGTSGQFLKHLGATDPDWATIAVADVSGLVATTGAVAVAAGGGASTFAGIRDNGVAENDRSNLNFVSSTSVTIAITDDAGNDELEISPQRAALTGAIAASANSNATLFAGIRDNGSAETDRTNLNFVSSTSATAVVTDDAGNDELEVTFQRAALTGAVSAAANVNATLFAGIRDNGSAETARTNINFVSSASVTLACTQDAGNDEIEVTASLPAWTELETTGAGPHNDLASGGARGLMFSNAAGVLNGIDTTEFQRGDIVAVMHQGTGFTDIDDEAGGSTATSRFAIVNNETLRLVDDEVALFCRLDITAGAGDGPRWVSITHRPPFCNTAANIAGDVLAHDGTDWQAVHGGAANRGASTTVTNSTSTLTFFTHTVAASSVAVGDTFYVRAVCGTSRGATVTASTLTFRVLVNGSIVGAGITRAINTTAISTGFASIECYAIVEAIGAGGSVGGYSECSDTVGAAGTELRGRGTAGLAVDTTASWTITAEASMSVAVANLSINDTVGICRKMST